MAQSISTTNSRNEAVIPKNDEQWLSTVEHLLTQGAMQRNLNGYDAKASLRICTLGGFRVWRNNEEIESTAWTREKAVHLIQFFITKRRQYLHKEQIIDQLWPDLDSDKGDRDFKVALNAINKALEPDRPPRTEPRFVQRHGLAYGLNLDDVWLDSEVFEQLITTANLALTQRQLSPQASEAERLAWQRQIIDCYRAAVQLYTGDYLPERRYEDWTSAERERLQILALEAMTTLAEQLLTTVPAESVRLAQRALTIDPVWEGAYRIQMRAHIAQGNRPLALRTYENCVKELRHEFDVEPLPETTQLYKQIINGEIFERIPA